MKCKDLMTWTKVKNETEVQKYILIKMKKEEKEKLRSFEEMNNNL